LAEDTVAGREYSVDARKVLELAYRTKCSAYDCEYVALAQDLNTELVTTDKQVLKAFPDLAVSLEKFAKKKK
jgi:predicted nucleic acid-binding protein